MPKLEDLFKQKVLESSGKTAKETFAPQNSKRIPIRSSNVIINKFAEPLNKVRLGKASVTEGETFLEETVTGLRPLAFLSQPALYGTNIVRLTTKTTVDVDAMKDDRGGANRGLLGGAVAKARAAITSAVNSIGLFPYSVFPNTLAGNLTYKYLTSTGNSSEVRRRIILQNSKGNGLGAFIKSVASTPMGSSDQGAQIGGSAITAIKDAGRNLLLGDGRLTDPKIKLSLTKYTNFWNYSNSMVYSKMEGVYDRNRNDLSSVLYDYNTLDSADLVKMLTKGIKPPFPLTLSPDTTPAPYGGGNKFGKNQKLEITNEKLIKRLRKSAPPKDAADTSRNFTNLEVNYGNQKNSDKGFGYVDTMNSQLPYVGTAGKIDDKSIEDLDFVRLKFSSPSRGPNNQGMSALFRATITGLTETITPTWDPSKFIGNPFNFYTYTSIEKTLAFTFKVYSSNQMEHIAIWERLNFLTSLAYPQAYVEGAVVPPFIKFSMGDLYRNKECFIESLTYTIPDDATWEIGIDQLERNGQETWIRNKERGKVAFDTINSSGVDTNITKDIKDYKLPSIIEVGISLKIVDDRKTVEDYKFYSTSPIMQGEKKPQQI